MDVVRRRMPGRACEEARSLASLALDGQVDELGALSLRRHVERCAECAAVIAEVQAVVATLRATPLELFASPEPDGVRHVMPVARRVSWAPTAAAVAAIVAAVVSLPNASTSASPLRPVVAAVDVPTWSAAPVPLPIGQRSAESDFAAGPHPLLA